MVVNYQYYICTQLTNKLKKHTMKNEKKVYEFKVTKSLALSNSFGVLHTKDNVLLNVSIGINSEYYGWFEFYSEGSNDWYAEGSLSFENNELIDYDGIFELPDFVLNKLDELGFNVSCMRESLI